MALLCSSELAPTAAPTNNFFCFTFLISKICFSILKFLCITPIPPFSAMAAAILPSVTVSMADDINGIFKVKFFDNFMDVLVSDGNISE